MTRFFINKSRAHCRVQIAALGFALLILSSCSIAQVKPGLTPTQHDATPALTDNFYPFTQIPIYENETGPWRLIRHIKKLGEEPIFFRAAFWDESFAATVGRKKGIYLSTDGGLTWQHSVEGFGTCGFGIEIVTPSVLWGCAKGAQGAMSGGGWDQSVRVSVNGGKTWQDTTRIPTEYAHASARCWDLSFIDQNSGWVSSFNQISSTQDGGLTWLAIPNPSRSVVVSVYVLTAQDVFILDDIGWIYITADGGQTWVSKSIGLQEGIKLAGWDEGYGSGTGVIHFADSQNGLVIANLLQIETRKLTQLVEMRSSDGGEHWVTTSISPPLGTLYLNRSSDLLTIVPFTTDLNADEIILRKYTE